MIVQEAVEILQSKIRTDSFDESFEEIQMDCALTMAIKALEKQNAVEKTLERLERLRKYEGYDDCPKDGMCNGEHCNTCYTDTAIQIIKEEFNIDELQNGSETQHSGTNCCNMEHIKHRFERVM